MPSVHRKAREPVMRSGRADSKCKNEEERFLISFISGTVLNFSSCRGSTAWSQRVKAGDFPLATWKSHGRQMCAILPLLLCRWHKNGANKLPLVLDLFTHTTDRCDIWLPATPALTSEHNSADANRTRTRFPMRKMSSGVKPPAQAERMPFRCLKFNRVSHLSWVT